MCIFCDIVEGKIPSVKVYEDEDFIAILDLAQVTRGHTLVIPKKHFDNILECDDETLSKMAIVTRNLAARVTEGMHAGGCNILNNCNPVAGQSIMHLHYHIIPRYGSDDAISVDFKPEHEEYDLNQIASEINH